MKFFKIIFLVAFLLLVFFLYDSQKKIAEKDNEIQGMQKTISRSEAKIRSLEKTNKHLNKKGIFYTRELHRVYDTCNSDYSINIDFFQWEQ